jgi:hypothetical protein
MDNWKELGKKLQRIALLYSPFLPIQLLSGGTQCKQPSTRLVVEENMLQVDEFASNDLRSPRASFALFTLVHIINTPNKLLWGFLILILSFLSYRTWRGDICLQTTGDECWSSEESSS